MRKSGLTLHIQARDADGNICHEETKENDLYLYNWGVLIAQFFKIQFQGSDPTVFEFHDTSGTSRNTTPNEFYGYSNQPWADGCRVQVGTGTNAPTITDHCLQQYVAEVIPSIPDIVVSGNTVKVVFTGSFSFANETICSECGIKMNGTLLAATPFLITRDTFTPVTVAAGGSLSIQFELWFNALPA